MWGELPSKRSCAAQSIKNFEIIGNISYLLFGQELVDEKSEEASGICGTGARKPVLKDNIPREGSNSETKALEIEETFLIWPLSLLSLKKLNTPHELNPQTLTVRCRIFKFNLRSHRFGNKNSSIPSAESLVIAFLSPCTGKIICWYQLHHRSDQPVAEYCQCSDHSPTISDTYISSHFSCLLLVSIVHTLQPPVRINTTTMASIDAASSSSSPPPAEIHAEKMSPKEVDDTPLSTTPEESPAVEIAAEDEDPFGDEDEHEVKFKTMGWMSVLSSGIVTDYLQDSADRNRQTAFVMIAETVSLGILSLPYTLKAVGLVP